MDEAETAVITAVMFTNQTYVDTLKKSGQFTVENQKEAFTKAFEKSVEIMSKEAIDFINDVYGSLDAWLPTQIEAKVNESKSKLGSPSN